MTASHPRKWAILVLVLAAECIFFVNLPLGLIPALGAARLIPESRVTPTPRLDLVR